MALLTQRLPPQISHLFMQAKYMSFDTSRENKQRALYIAESLKQATSTKEAITFIKRESQFAPVISKLSAIEPTHTPTTKAEKDANLFKKGIEVQPHKDHHYVTCVVALGTYNKDTHQLVDEPNANLLVEHKKDTYELPQNPPLNSMVTFEGHHCLHGTTHSKSDLIRLQLILLKYIPDLG